MRLGERIKELRKEKGLNRSELARALKLSPQAVRKWEEFDAEPTGRNLEKLCQVLNTTPKYILHGNKKPPSAPSIEVKMIPLIDWSDILLAGSGTEPPTVKLLPIPDIINADFFVKIEGSAMAGVASHGSYAAFEISSTPKHNQSALILKEGTETPVFRKVEFLDSTTIVLACANPNADIPKQILTKNDKVLGVCTLVFTPTPTP